MVIEILIILIFMQYQNQKCFFNSCGNVPGSRPACLLCMSRPLEFDIVCHHHWFLKYIYLPWETISENSFEVQYLKDVSADPVSRLPLYKPQQKENHWTQLLLRVTIPFLPHYSILTKSIVSWNYLFSLMLIFKGNVRQNMHWYQSMHSFDIFLLRISYQEERKTMQLQWTNLHKSEHSHHCHPGIHLRSTDKLFRKIRLFFQPPQKVMQQSFWVAQDLILVLLILIMQKFTKISLFGHFLGYPPEMHYSALQCSAMYWRF